MPQDLMNPGAAFAGGLQDYLTQEEVAKHNRLMDQIAIAQEQRLQQAQLDNHQFQVEKMNTEAHDRAEARAEKIKTDQEAADEKQRTALGKRYNPGDYPESADIPNVQRLALGTQEPDTPVPFTGPLAPDQAPPDQGTGPGQIAPTPGGMRISGTALQREKQTALAYINGMPDGPAKQAAMFRLMTGSTEPAGAFDKPVGNEDLYTFNPITGKYLNAAGQAVSQVPKTGHIGNLAVPEKPKAEPGWTLDDAIDASGNRTKIRINTGTGQTSVVQMPLGVTPGKPKPATDPAKLTNAQEAAFQEYVKTAVAAATGWGLTGYSKPDDKAMAKIINESYAKAKALGGPDAGSGIDPGLAAILEHLKAR